MPAKLYTTQSTMLPAGNRLWKYRKVIIMKAVRTGPDYPLCRLYHGRGPPPPGGPRSTATFLPRCFDDRTSFSVCIGHHGIDLNVTTTTKKGQLFGEEKCTPSEKIACQEKILATRMRKGPRLTLGWGPRMVNPALNKNRFLTAELNDALKTGLSVEKCQETQAYL